MNTYFILKYISIVLIGLISSSIISASEPIMLEKYLSMPKYNHYQCDTSNVSVPKLFTIGTLDHYSHEHTFDEIDIDTTTSTSTRSALDQLNITPFKLDLSQKQYNSKDFQELIPYAKTLYGLNISETQLSNNAMPFLSYFKQLRFLDLSDNRFDDEGFSIVGSFRELTELRFNYNNLTSKSIQYIRFLDKIKTIDAGCTYLGNTGIKELSTCKSLVSLNLEACSFDDTVLSYFHTMPELRILNISGNKGLTTTGIQKFLSEKNPELFVKYSQ